MQHPVPSLCHSLSSALARKRQFGLSTSCALLLIMLPQLNMAELPFGKTLLERRRGPRCIPGPANDYSATLHDPFLEELFESELGFLVNSVRSSSSQYLTTPIQHRRILRRHHHFPNIRLMEGSDFCGSTPGPASLPRYVDSRTWLAKSNT